MKVLKAVGLALLLVSARAMAGGTAADTTISNTASVSYDVGASTFVETSNTLTLKVDELIDVTVNWQDGGNVAVQIGAADQTLLFRVTNIGNGSETFALTGTNQAGDDFQVTGIQLYEDDGDGVFEPGTDDAAVASVTLDADDFADIWISSDIPAAGLANDDLSNVRLAATANTGTGAAGTAFAGAGTNGVDAVVGTSGGSANDDGNYEVQDIVITATKTQAVNDPFGGTQPVPGATITYTIVISASGSATATNAFFEDDIPADTSYVAASVTLDGGGQTDGNDADDCDVSTTNAAGVYCELPDMTDGDSHTVTFDVTID